MQDIWMTQLDCFSDMLHLPTKFNDKEIDMQNFHKTNEAKQLKTKQHQQHTETSKCS